MAKNSKIAIGAIIAASVATAASYRKQDNGKALANSPYQSDLQIRFGKTDKRENTVLPLSTNRKAVLDVASSANTDEDTERIRQYLITKAVFDLASLSSDQLVAIHLLDSMLENGYDVAGQVNGAILTTGRNAEVTINNVTNEDLTNFVRVFKSVWTRWFGFPVADDTDQPARIAKPGSLFTTRK